MLMALADPLNDTMNGLLEYAGLPGFLKCSNASTLIALDNPLNSVFLVSYVVIRFDSNLGSRFQICAPCRKSVSPENCLDRPLIILL